MLHKKDDISNKLGQKFYNLVAYKKENNDLYYVICYCTSLVINDFTGHLNITLLYYKINIQNGYNFELKILNKEITTTTSSGGNLDGHSNTITCQYMSYFSENISYNYLTCFLTLTSPSELNAFSFDLDNNLDLISDKISYILEISDCSNYISSTKILDTKIIICYSVVSSVCACCYYDVILNNFTTNIIYLDYCASKDLSMDVKYYKSTNEILISCLDDNLNYTITTLNPDNLTIINEKKHLNSQIDL